MSAHAIMPSSGLGTPETYLDAQRAQGFAQPLQGGTHFYPGVLDPPVNEFGLHGTWNVTSQSATPVSQRGLDHRRLPGPARLPGPDLGRQRARAASGCCSAATRSPPATPGPTSHGGLVTVRGQRLYSLISLPADAQGAFTLEIPPGVSAYDFTFG